MTYLNQKNKKQIKIKGKFVELPSPDEVRKEWGISFGERFVEVIARTLNKEKKPKIIRGKLRQKKDFSGINFDSSNCSLITFPNILSLAKNDCSQLCAACKYFGISFYFPELIKLNSYKEE